ncbi:MAG TPA: glycosyltransferase, partial [Candidatus Paceibacterota bacterium]|nr:glycosyltransferase [Candidatus Paceibacterota bacterium]
ACHQGAQSANGALLLFVDADTWFEPDGLNRILSHYEGGAFSVGPYHAVRNAYEDLSLFFNLNMIVGTVPDRLFGQMLLVDRDSFARVGGHEAVKGRILENYFLARQFHDSNIAVRSAIGRGVLSFRMYPNGLRELMDGWTKGFAAGAAQTPGRVLLLVVAWMTGLTLVPIGGLAAANGFWWGIAYLLCAGQVMWLSRLIGSFKWFTAFLYPLPLLFFFAVFTRSSLRSGKQVTWKGREIRAD